MQWHSIAHLRAYILCCEAVGCRYLPVLNELDHNYEDD